MRALIVLCLQKSFAPYQVLHLFVSLQLSPLFLQLLTRQSQFASQLLQWVILLLALVLKTKLHSKPLALWLLLLIHSVLSLVRL